MAAGIPDSDVKPMGARARAPVITVTSAYYVRRDIMDTVDKTFTFLLSPPSAINTPSPPLRKGTLKYYTHLQSGITYSQVIIRIISPYPILILTPDGGYKETPPSILLVTSSRCSTMQIILQV